MKDSSVYTCRYSSRWCTIHRASWCDLIVHAFMRAAHTIAYLPLYCQLWNFATKLEIFVFSRRLSVLKISSHCSGQTQLKAGIIYPISDKKLFIWNFKTASCLAVAFSAQIHKTLKFLIQNKNELKFKSCVIIQQQFSPNSSYITIFDQRWSLFKWPRMKYPGYCIHLCQIKFRSTEPP